MPGKKYIEVQGHRGARAYYPENTITSFIEAIKMSVDAIEMDVVISKDQKVVVSHEPWMNSLFCSTPGGQAIEKKTEKTYNLYQMPYSEIVKFDCGKKGNSEFPLQKAIAEHKPLLSEVVDEIETYIKTNNLDPIKYTIEIKSEPGGDNIYNPPPGLFVDLVISELKSKNILHKVILQSFDARILQEIRKKDPSIQLAFLVENKDGLEKNVKTLGFLPNIYAPEFILIDKALATELHAKNIKLITWTVNENKDIQKMIDLEVDGIISDYPDRVFNLLKK